MMAQTCSHCGLIGHVGLIFRLRHISLTLSSSLANSPGLHMRRHTDGSFNTLMSASVWPPLNKSTFQNVFVSVGQYYLEGAETEESLPHPSWFTLF